VRNLAQPLGADNTTVYLSFLIRPQGTLNGGVFNGFFGVTLNGSFGQELFTGKPGVGAVEKYVIENRGGAGQVASGTPTVVGQTALLVVRADFLPGNDSFTLYTNPTPGGVEPTGGIVKTDLNLGVVSRLGIYSTGRSRSMKSDSERRSRMLLPGHPLQNCLEPRIATAKRSRPSGSSTAASQMPLQRLDTPTWKRCRMPLKGSARAREAGDCRDSVVRERWPGTENGAL
jgi:hypothetical protein